MRRNTASLQGFNIEEGDVVMKITITGRKCTPRESFKTHAEKKLAKIERFFGEEAEAKITATVEKSAKIVEITVAHGGMIFRAEERAEDMEDALDAALILWYDRSVKTKPGWKRGCVPERLMRIRIWSRFQRSWISMWYAQKRFL